MIIGSSLMQKKGGAWRLITQGLTPRVALSCHWMGWLWTQCSNHHTSMTTRELREPASALTGPHRYGVQGMGYRVCGTGYAVRSMGYGVPKCQSLACYLLYQVGCLVPYQTVPMLHFDTRYQFYTRVLYCHTRTCIWALHMVLDDEGDGTQAIYRPFGSSTGSVVFEFQFYLQERVAQKGYYTIPV